MAIPGLFVEYLISGALALVWLFPLLEVYALRGVDKSYLPLYALGLYFMGMIIDAVAWGVTWIIKWPVRAYVDKKQGFKTSDSFDKRHIKLALYAPEVAKEYAMRSSRDRIARGAMINSVMATFLLPAMRDIRVLNIPVGLLLIILTLVVWIGFEYNSYRYELTAEEVVNDKINRSR
jgi:hypothetical protein